ncbi:sensor histidine kinase [Actinoplanes couchii]|uniref:histidine kinase n=1 Tax=Actinoplanes couchii TaxID=403638 RepID=A0ABQ3X7S8_9ACTN|nr:sensor histidine kinase [Actinoplanes couchii]MDR6320434.1 signal transduction histidine kinase [Actinoplanes couchii]GID54554.1 two-component sensor histidine kinase [Actinoplanes couchii]
MWREFAIAGLVLGLCVTTVLTTTDGGDRAMMPLGWALLVAGSAALLGRQRFPVIVLVVTGVVALLYYPFGFPDSPIALSLVIALYTVARERGPVVSGSAAAVLLLAFAAGGFDDWADAGQVAIGVAPILLVAVVLGEVARGRIQRVERAEAAASQRAVEERLRIAREVHDVVAHRIALINVQAGAALHTRSPDGAFEALANIRTASKEALHEVRTVLNVLREPDLTGLPELFRRAGAAGVGIRSTVEAPKLPVPAGAAVYRIVQEALTNTIRHAHATSAEVRIVREGDRLTVTVDDDGRASPGPPSALLSVGNGLRGMAERIAALGGRFQAGPRPGGGFRVRAELPINPDENGTR